MTFDVRPGDPASSVVLHVPHASRELIESGLLVDGATLAEELDQLTDAYTDVIAERAARTAGLRPWLFVNRLSRLVVDPERFPGPDEEMLARGMGPIYTHGFAGRRLRTDDPARDERLIREHFDPYAAGMTALVEERLAATGRATVLDVHSYPSAALPYELHGCGPRPAVCLGTDPFHTPPSLRTAAAAAFGDVGFDSPFRGCYVPLAQYRREPAVTALMVEIRRDRYLREPAGEPTGGLDRMAGALAVLIDATPTLSGHRSVSRRVG